MAQCVNCGFSAPDSAFFRREKGGRFNHLKTVCEGCTPYQPTAYEIRLIMARSLSVLTWGLILSFHFRNDFANTLCVAIMVLSAFVTWPVRLAVHEAGHAFAAKMVGQEIWKIRLGRGPVKRVISVAGIPFEVGRYLHADGEMRYFSPRKRPISRYALAFIVAAGPGANLICAALLLSLCFLMSSLNDIALPLIAILAGMGFSQALMGLYNLLPQKIGDTEGLVSDGKQLLDLFSRAPVSNSTLDRFYRVIGLMHLKRYEEAITEAQEDLWLDSFFTGFYINQILHALSRHAGDEAAIAFYFKHEERLADIKASDRYWLEANIAWSAIKSGTYPELAERFSESALKGRPNEAAMQGTRGAWFVANGQLDIGIRFLTEASRGMNDWRDKADWCNWMARGWRKKGDAIHAALLEALGQHYLKHSVASAPRLPVRHDAACRAGAGLRG
jgi:Zn-dependent protease